MQSISKSKIKFQQLYFGEIYNLVLKIYRKQRDKNSQGKDEWEKQSWNSYTPYIKGIIRLQ